MQERGIQQKSKRECCTGTRKETTIASTSFRAELNSEDQNESVQYGVSYFWFYFFLFIDLFYCITFYLILYYYVLCCCYYSESSLLYYIFYFDDFEELDPESGIKLF
jgi:hypothetical protein